MYLQVPSDNKKYSRPRGHYLDRTPEEWSKDTTKAHFEGTWNRFVWPTIKFLTLVIIFLASKNVLMLSAGYCFLICMLVTMTYQHVVAAIVPNTIVLAPMDH